MNPVSPELPRRARILVIDDDDTQREFIAACLVRDGYSVEVAENAASGHEARFRFLPDLIVMDIHMPGIDGFELLDDWRSAEADTVPPVIFVSAQEERSRYRRSMQLGAVDYLVKPVPRAALIAAVQGALATWRPTDPAPPSEPPSSNATSATTSVSDAAPGYEVIRQLGQGGNATVYLALHRPSKTQRALKILGLDEEPDSEAISRFISEAHAVQDIHHAGVAQVLDYGVGDDTMFIAMEYLPGGDLRQEIREVLSVERAVTYALRILDALSTVHAHGLVHRDIKPANLLLRGPNDLVLTDFGIAKKLQGSIALTRADHLIGTLHYMSPEQAGGSTIDGRSDLYSTGVVLMEMLTGNPPFTGATPEEIIARILHAPAPPLPPALAPLQPVVERLLAKNPDARYADANSSHAALAAALRLLV